MCYFCEDKAIKDYEKYYNDWANNRYYESVDREPVCICYDKDRDEFHIWVECGDPFFSGTALKIDYCPICGRRLTNG